MTQIEEAPRFTLRGSSALDGILIDQHLNRWDSASEVACFFIRFRQFGRGKLRVVLRCCWRMMA